MRLSEDRRNDLSYIGYPYTAWFTEFILLVKGVVAPEKRADMDVRKYNFFGFLHEALGLLQESKMSEAQEKFRKR